MRKPSHIATALAVATFALFSPSLTHEFVNYDDTIFVTENKVVQSGLSWGNVVWAFTEAPYSCPLAWVSHMTDVSLFGAWAGGHHLVNVLFHVANVALLFHVLRRMTGALWPSAIVAALFGWHPLHVESVAWIAERRDVLSTFFWLLMMLAYLRYTQAPGWRRHVPVFVWMLLGLLSKAMLVTAPFVLLLLDFWPLGRMKDALAVNPAAARRVAVAARVLQLALEKTPLFLLAAFFTLEGVFTAQMTGLLEINSRLPFDFRIANATVGYVRYLFMTVWPERLAVFYPLPLSYEGWKVFLAAALLAAVTWRAVSQWKRRPWELVGWFWFLGTLVPVIGIVQGGVQAVADRYTYVPLVGLFLAAVWGVSELAARRNWASWFRFALACAPLLACIGFTTFQLPFWRNSESLFRRAIAVTGGSDIAHMNLGAALAHRGRFAEAVLHYEACLRFRERSHELKRMPAHLLAEAHQSLGSALIAAGRSREALASLERARALLAGDAATLAALGTALALQGRQEEGVATLKQAVRSNPGHPRALENLVALLGQLGRAEEAAAFLRDVSAAAPSLAGPRYHLANVLADLGRVPEALAACKDALRVEPRHGGAWFTLGNLLHGQGREAEALAAFEAAVAIEPDLAPARFNLGALLLQSGNAADAARHFEAGLKLDANSVEGHFNLAQALTRLGRTAEARAHMETAQRLNAARQQTK
jgi:tetratricopeptide (TPR) repeat protein